MDDPADLARRCADAMWAEDRASRFLGMTLDAVGPGTATVSLTVTPDMANGHGICHGGFIFTLADSAFAFACNSHGDRAVAQNAQVTFLRPGRLGERLVANAREIARSGRSGITDVTVVNAEGTAIAEFRGQSRLTGGRFFATD